MLHIMLLILIMGEESISISSTRQQIWFTQIAMLALLVSVSPVVEYMAGQGTTRYIDDRLDNDTITFRFISYLTNVATSSPNLIGIGDIDLDIVNPSDSSITEINKITVDAYTELETAAKFYDRAKSYLYDNFNGQISTIISRSGNTIEAGSYNVRY